MSGFGGVDVLRIDERPEPAAAHARMEANANIGKIVLRVPG